MLLKVGQLAKRTGLTVRTLHHYDAIGLLKPSARSDAGYRLYNQADIARLHSVQGLRNLGLPLSDIDRMLAMDGASLPDIISRQLLALDQEIARATELRARLTNLQDGLLGGAQPDPENWLVTLGLMTTYGKYFSAAELKFIRESWKKIEAEWQPLIADVCAAAEKKLDIQSREMQTLARRWMDLSMRWMADDIDLLQRWGEMCRRVPEAHAGSGIDAESYAYIGKAIELRVAAFRKHLNTDQIKRIRKDMDKKWAEIEKAAQRLLRKNTSPTSDAAQELVGQWSDLLDETCDRDPVLREKFFHAIKTEPLIQAGSPFSPEVGDFIREAYFAGQALAAAV
ncbi:MerR family transcriptional regulator [soil metagenome]